MSLLWSIRFAGNIMGERPGKEGTMNLFDIAQAQNGFWFSMWMPLSAIIFLVCLFAETNRLPFDMAESETELVSGFHTEYSSFKFGLFFVGEYAYDNRVVRIYTAFPRRMESASVCDFGNIGDG